MRTLPIAVATMLVTLTAACGTPSGAPATTASSTPPTTSTTTSVPIGSPDAAALAAAEARWATLGATRYRFTLVRSCYCLEEWTGPFDVTVVDGVAEVTRLGVAVDPTIAAALPRTAELLFAHLWAHVDDTDYRATFDPATGLPLSFWSDPIPEAADDELGLDVSDLRLG